MICELQILAIDISIVMFMHVSRTFTMNPLSRQSISIYQVPTMTSIYHSFYGRLKIICALEDQILNIVYLTCF